MSDFSLYRHAWISAPHFNRQLSDNECKNLLKKGGWMVRNTYNFDQKEESDFWYVVKDSFGGMDELSANVRNEIAEEYYRELPQFVYRLKVKAGLTGYAQIYGKYNTTSYDKLKLDMLYVENCSILLDIKIILITLKVIFQKESTEGLEEGKTIATK